MAEDRTPISREAGGSPSASPSSETTETDRPFFEKVRGTIPPPLSQEAAQEAADREPPLAPGPIASDRVPLLGATVKLPCSLAGNALAELTEYDGWRFTQEELDYIAEIVQACEIHMSPVGQAVIGLTSVLLVKTAGYAAFRRARRRGTERATGHQAREEAS